MILVPMRQGRYLLLDMDGGVAHVPEVPQMHLRLPPCPHEVRWKVWVPSDPAPLIQCLPFALIACQGSFSWEVKGTAAILLLQTTEIHHGLLHSCSSIASVNPSQVRAAFKDSWCELSYLAAYYTFAPHAELLEQEIMEGESVECGLKAPLDLLQTLGSCEKGKVQGTLAPVVNYTVPLLSTRGSHKLTTLQSLNQHVESGGLTEQMQKDFQGYTGYHRIYEDSALGCQQTATGDCLTESLSSGCPLFDRYVQQVFSFYRTLGGWIGLWPDDRVRLTKKQEQVWDNDYDRVTALHKRLDEQPWWLIQDSLMQFRQAHPHVTASRDLWRQWVDAGPGAGLCSTQKRLNWRYHSTALAPPRFWHDPQGHWGSPWNLATDRCLPPVWTGLLALQLRAPDSALTTPDEKGLRTRDDFAQAMCLHLDLMHLELLSPWQQKIRGRPWRFKKEVYGSRHNHAEFIHPWWPDHLMRWSRRVVLVQPDVIGSTSKQSHIFPDALVRAPVNRDCEPPCRKKRRPFDDHP